MIVTVWELSLGILMTFIVGVITGQYIKIIIRFEKPKKETEA